jgi:hypothetical protein
LFEAEQDFGLSFEQLADGPRVGGMDTSAFLCVFEPSEELPLPPTFGIDPEIDGIPDYRSVPFLR